MFKKARQTFVEKEIAWTGSCIVHPCEIAPEAEQETEGTVTDIRSKANGAGVHGGAVRGDTRELGRGARGGLWGRGARALGIAQVIAVSATAWYVRQPECRADERIPVGTVTVPARGHDRHHSGLDMIRDQCSASPGRPALG